MYKHIQSHVKSYVAWILLECIFGISILTSFGHFICVWMINHIWADIILKFLYDILEVKSSIFKHIQAYLNQHYD